MFNSFKTSIGYGDTLKVYVQKRTGLASNVTKRVPGACQVCTSDLRLAFA